MAISEKQARSLLDKWLGWNRLRKGMIKARDVVTFENRQCYWFYSKLLGRNFYVDCETGRVYSPRE